MRSGRAQWAGPKSGAGPGLLKSENLFFQFLWDVLFCFVFHKEKLFFSFFSKYKLGILLCFSFIFPSKSLLAACPWACYLPSLCLGVSICNLGIRGAPTSLRHGRSKQVNSGECLTQAKRYIRMVVFADTVIPITRLQPRADSVGSTCGWVRRASSGSHVSLCGRATRVWGVPLYRGPEGRPQTA